jgi:hypothetical protein
MGHYWREMDPEDARAHDELAKRAKRIRERLKNVPLSAFRATDLPALLLIVPNGLDKINYHRCGHEELDLIEQRLNEWCPPSKT